MGFWDTLKDVGEGFATGGILPLVNGVMDATKDNFQAQLPPIQQQSFGDAIQKSQQGLDQNASTQQTLAQALLAQSQGKGPNPALDQLHQTTDQNNAAAASLAASQRGLNPALAARMALQTQANNNQQAVGQAAVLRANQQLAAQSQAGNVLGTIGQEHLQNQGILQGANASQNNAINQGYLGEEGINADVAGQNSKTRGAIIGGVLNAGGGVAAAALSDGGRVPGTAQVAGDSKANDTVPTMLSPGEIVVPRSATTNSEKAKAFIDALMKENRGSSKKKEPMSYGEVLKAHRDLQARVAKLEKVSAQGDDA